MKNVNSDIIEGNWKQLKGAAQKKWGEITSDKFDEVEGSRTKLAGLVQEAYGYSREKAADEVSKWEKATCNSGCQAA